jgi:hypothetical protein
MMNLSKWFLDFWRDANPGIAEVEDVKKRLVGQKTSNKPFNKLPFIR